MLKDQETAMAGSTNREDLVVLGCTNTPRTCSRLKSGTIQTENEFVNHKPPDFPTVARVFSVKIMVNRPRSLKDDVTIHADVFS